MSIYLIDLEDFEDEFEDDLLEEKFGSKIKRAATKTVNHFKKHGSTYKKAAKNIAGGVKAFNAAKKLELLEDDEFDDLLEEKFGSKLKRAATKTVGHFKKNAGTYKAAAKNIKTGVKTFKSFSKI